MLGSEDPLQIFSNGAYLFKRGQVEHILTMANLKLKPSLFIRSTNMGAISSEYDIHVGVPFLCTDMYRKHQHGCHLK